MTKLPVVRKAHADLGASKSERWMNCPGSVALEAGLPDRPTDDSRAGTAAHELAQRSLEKGLDPETWLGCEFDVEGTPVEVDEDMVDAVRVFVDHVMSLIDDPADELFIERKFDLSPLNPPGPMYGTADAVVWKPRTRVLIICDLKFGRGVVVDVTENSQTRYYALGAVLEVGRKPRLIRPTIVQPRAYHPQGIVRSEEVTYEELVAFKDQLFAAAARTFEPGAPLAVGDWCRFCKAQPVCPAQHAKMVEIAQGEFTVGPVELPAPALLGAERLVKVLAVAPTLREWLRSVEQWAKNELDAGRPVPGYKLVPKRANRKWADAEQAAGLLRAGLDAEDLYTRKLVSVAQAEKLLKKANLTLDEIGAEIVQQSSGSNLVPESDAREALVPSAQAEFAVGEPAPQRRPRKRRQTK